MKIKKKSYFFLGGGGGRVGGGGGNVTPTNCSLKIYLKRALGGGGQVGGVRMDVNEELKFL